jgi:hypothetical protein
MQSRITEDGLYEAGDVRVYKRSESGMDDQYQVVAGGSILIETRHLAVVKSGMECDIAKLRKALGDVRMKEILGQ